MNVNGRVVVVTGGANGIGRALCHTLHHAGAAHVVVADLDLVAAQRVARDVQGTAIACDVSRESEIINLVEQVETAIGPISLFCSNAGVLIGIEAGGENVASAANDLWEKSWQVNVMAHVYAARTLLPRMIPRGEGYFQNTISAAGLLSAIGSATYSVTKHAAIGFAESLAIAHKADGIGVSALCPQAVDTNMIRGLNSGAQAVDGVMSAEDVAQIAVCGVENSEFLILPHPEVLTYMRKKTDDYGKWISGMAKLKSHMAKDMK